MERLNLDSSGGAEKTDYRWRLWIQRHVIMQSSICCDPGLEAA
jgi:hypothetical protein